MTTLEMPYIEYKRQGKVPPHLLPAFHVYLHVVRAGANIGASEPARLARVASMIRLVDSDEEAFVWEERGALVRWSA